MMTKAKQLLELIQRFEALFIDSDAAGKVNLSNPETGDPSDVDLVFARGHRTNALKAAGLYVIGTGGGQPTRLIDAMAPVRARAAFHLPALAVELGNVIEVTERESAKGIATLEKFFEGARFVRNDDVPCSLALSALSPGDICPACGCFARRHKAWKREKGSNDDIETEQAEEDRSGRGGDGAGSDDRGDSGGGVSSSGGGGEEGMVEVESARATRGDEEPAQAGGTPGDVSRRSEDEEGGVGSTDRGSGFDASSPVFAEFKRLLEDFFGARVEATSSGADPVDDIDAALDAVRLEVLAAAEVYPPYNSAHEAFGVLWEEVDEFLDEVKLKQPLRMRVRMRKELTQIACVAVRALAALDGDPEWIRR